MFVPRGDSVHLGGLKLPNPLVENVTCPIGLVAPVALVSVIVAVQVVDMPTITGEVHEITALVGFTVTDWATLAP